MAVGFPTKANWAAGDILTAAQMDDLAGTLNTVQAPLGNAAGKNVILNSAFDYWQRGTSISVPTNTITFGPDRFRTYCTFSAGTASFSQQTFTPGTAPVAGYEGTYFARLTCGSTSTYAELSQKLKMLELMQGRQ